MTRPQDRVQQIKSVCHEYVTVKKEREQHRANVVMVTFLCFLNQLQYSQLLSMRTTDNTEVLLDSWMTIFRLVW